MISDNEASLIKINNKFRDRNYINHLQISLIWPKLVLYAGIIIFGLLLGVLSSQIYHGYNNSMFDLGNMAQSIWSVFHGRPLEFTINNGQLSRLGLHVELIYLLISPIYAIYPQPPTLLFFQSFLFAIGAIPVYQIAIRNINRPAYALAFVFMYLLYPVAQTAVLFDFHGDTLAMPILLFALNSLEQQRWKAYALFIILALCCKFYVSVPVFFLGLVIIYNNRKGPRVNKIVGILTALVAISWGILTFLFIRPFFSPGEGFTLSSSVSPFGYVTYYFSELINGLVNSSAQRIGVLFLILAPVIWLSCHSLIWLIPAAVTAVPSLLSNGIQYTYLFHHYALAVPFLIYSAVKGVSKLQNKDQALGKISIFYKPEKMIQLSLLMTFILNITIVDTPLNPLFWSRQPGKGIDSLRYGVIPRDRMKDELLSSYNRPDESLAVSWALAPHLTNRHTLYVLDYFDINSRDFNIAIADGLFDYAVPVPGGFTGGVLHDAQYIQALLNRPDYSLLNVQDGLLFFVRDHNSDNLDQTIENDQIGKNAKLLHTYSDLIGAIDATIVQKDNNVYTMKFTWNLVGNLQEIGPVFAITRFRNQLNRQEISNFRVIHIPTEIIYPAIDWKKDETIIETFDIRIPENFPSGTYLLSTVWYIANNIDAYKTDNRSQLGDEWYWGEIKISKK
ncbi:MAG: hypothetical protein C3F13_09345 [Anaerolineales bacterium]|nr:MAG: hypothetical protein C3F13_09345 [Anaerolineales bacterium]